MFKILKNHTSSFPTNINIGFESAVVSSATNIMKCSIQGCFFHLSQNLVKRLRKTGLIEQSGKKGAILSFTAKKVKVAKEAN